MLHIEQVESRRLLSATLNGRELEIVGTAGDDVVTVWVNKAATRVIVQDNGVESSFRASRVRALEIDTFAGNDLITLGENLFLGGDIDAGAGNDTVFGGSGNDDIDGGDGDDVLYGNAGNDEIDGDAGNDALYGGLGNDDLEGGTGTDRLLGGSGRDTLEGGQGVDQLVGGSGSDAFDLDDDASELVDFVTGVDRRTT